MTTEEAAASAKLLADVRQDILEAMFRRRPTSDAGLDKWRPVALGAIFSAVAAVISTELFYEDNTVTHGQWALTLMEAFPNIIRESSLNRIKLLRRLEPQSPTAH